MKRCHHCGSEWVSEKKQPAVKEPCPVCHAYLHCCLNCRHREPALHNECAIPTTDWVGDRAGCNFCDEFEFVDADMVAADHAAADEARNALDLMFGGPEPHPRDEERLSAFKRLFGE